MEDDSTDSDFPTKPKKSKKLSINEPSDKPSDKKQSKKTKDVSIPNKLKKSAPDKVKKIEKKPSMEKKVAKKKSKEIFEEERLKILKTVEENKPFGDDKLHLIADSLAMLVYFFCFSKFVF